MQQKKRQILLQSTAAMQSDNAYMQYAGYHLALVYALSECRKREDIDYQQLYQDIDKNYKNSINSCQRFGRITQILLFLVQKA